MDATQSAQACEAVRAGPRLAGARNFRDAGGYSVPDGRRVRRHRLFRSGELSRLTEQDVAILEGLGLRELFDLRSPAERLDRPGRWPRDDSVERWSEDVAMGVASHARRLRDLLAEDPGAGGARRMMLETYRMLPTQCANVIRALMTRLALGDGPVLVHCTAGKDRTGVVCACVQYALGMTKDAIFADYLLSAERLDREALREPIERVINQGMGVVVDQGGLDVINSVSGEFLTAMFESVEARFGTMDGLLSWSGVDVDTLARLKERMLESPPTAREEPQRTTLE